MAKGRSMRLLRAACIVVAALLSGCGDSGNSTPGDQPTGSSTTQGPGGRY